MRMQHDEAGSVKAKNTSAPTLMENALSPAKLDPSQMSVARAV